MRFSKAVKISSSSLRILYKSLRSASFSFCFIGRHYKPIRRNDMDKKINELTGILMLQGKPEEQIEQLRQALLGVAKRLNEVIKKVNEMEE